MELLSINSESEIIVKLKLNELNDFISWKNASEYDQGFNQGWEMAENEYTNAKK